MAKKDFEKLIWNLVLTTKKYFEYMLKLSLCCTELFNFANKLHLYCIVLIINTCAGVFVTGTLVSSGCLLHSCQFYTSFYLKLLDLVKTKCVRYAKTRPPYIKHETSHTNVIRICSVSVPTRNTVILIICILYNSIFWKRGWIYTLPLMLKGIYSWQKRTFVFVCLWSNYNLLFKVLQT